MNREIRIGSRNSKLAQVQVSEAMALFQSLLPGIAFDKIWFSSPGDRDQATELEGAPDDFFTSDLDAALLSGEIDCALHSAKDFPNPAPAGIDWFWLPCGHDRRDVWVGSLSPRVIGVSSARRRAYAEKQYPEAILRPLRGTMERRLAQMDAGDFDAFLAAGVALQRLGLDDRITHWISHEDLPTPDGQGSLLVAFRAGDERLQRLRSLFVAPVILASAGTSMETCTLGVSDALRRADVCLYDALLDPQLLKHLPEHAQAIYVGKRSGNHSSSQSEICEQLVHFARMGRRVVRLKGGDAGFYGRLAEEVDALDSLGLPFRVLPGVSSVSVATTGTGLLLTRRGVTDRVHILSGHSELAHKPAADGSQTEVIFMGTRCLETIVNERMAGAYAPSTPAAVVWAAGLPQELVVCGTLSTIVAQAREVDAGDAPGLILIGRAMEAAYRYREHGALRGKRVWVTCSDDVQKRACDAIRDYGGFPIAMPLIRLVPEHPEVDWKQYDWIIVTSPSAVRCLLAQGMDVRALPRILCCGPGTAAALRQARIQPDAQPLGAFSTEGVLAEAARIIERDARILRIRSDRAGGGLSDMLRSGGHKVDDVVICRNEHVSVAAMPDFDAVLFASSSAVESFLEQYAPSVLREKSIGVMGYKEIEVLTAAGIRGLRVPARFTLPGAVATMAGQIVEKEILI